MRHAYFGKKLSRTIDARKQLLRVLARNVFVHGHITTTKAKAKAVQPIVEKIITKAKAGTEQKRREALALLPDKTIIAQIFDDAKTRYAKRTSGFTGLVGLPSQRGDAGAQVLFRLVDEPIIAEVIPPTTKAKSVAPVVSEKARVKKTKSAVKK